MRRRDLRLVAIVLSTGGWVCQTNADNRCPGALTCDIQVANVCCPFGSNAWCDGCVATGDACHGQAYTCDDDSRVLECSFSASITDLQCGDPVPTTTGAMSWKITGVGTMNGCGQETAFVASTVANEGLDCGSWDLGVFGGCIPPSDSVSTTTWRLDQSLELGTGQTAMVMVQVLRGHGLEPVLASSQIACGP